MCVCLCVFLTDTKTKQQAENRGLNTLFLDLLTQDNQSFEAATLQSCINTFFKEAKTEAKVQYTFLFQHTDVFIYFAIFVLLSLGKPLSQD